MNKLFSLAMMLMLLLVATTGYSGGPMPEQQMIYPVVQESEKSIFDSPAVVVAFISGIFAIITAIVSKVKWDRKVRREERERDDMA